MKILIIGASRGIGKALMECALEENNEVTVLARNPSKITANHTQLSVLEGDILNLNSITSALKGQDAVCSCIGCPITFKPVDLFSRGAENIVTALTGERGKKYVTVTGIGAGDSKGHGGFLYDKIFNPLFLKTIYQDKDREEAIIKSSPLDWLIVRPAGLTNGPRTSIYHAINDMSGVTMKRISRRDVADFILKELQEPSNFGKTPLLTY
ncbi:MAG: SDR family oxidoreductase [Deltaproteobacteria bacterium]|nr:SDR family oxidoreductase [Deltaproteobacteria bacterium]